MSMMCFVLRYSYPISAMHNIYLLLIPRRWISGQATGAGMRGMLLARHSHLLRTASQAAEVTFIHSPLMPFFALMVRSFMPATKLSPTASTAPFGFHKLGPCI